MFPYMLYYVNYVSHKSISLRVWTEFISATDLVNVSSVQLLVLNKSCASKHQYFSRILYRLRRANCISSFIGVFGWFSIPVRVLQHRIIPVDYVTSYYKPTFHLRIFKNFDSILEMPFFSNPKSIPAYLYRYKHLDDKCTTYKHFNYAIIIISHSKCTRKMYSTEFSVSSKIIDLSIHISLKN